MKITREGFIEWLNSLPVDQPIVWPKHSCCPIVEYMIRGLGANSACAGAHVPCHTFDGDKWFDNEDWMNRFIHFVDGPVRGRGYRWYSITPAIALDFFEENPE